MSHIAKAARDVPRMPEAIQSTAIDVRGLHVRRRRTTILRGLDFTVDSGRITGLLGPSGSGKTTLMRTLVGAQRITKGTVTVLGRPAGAASLRHEVGYLTQDPSVYPDLSVEANVRYFGAMHGMKAPDIAAAIAAVGLEKFTKQRAADLSGGEFSRVSLACALVSRPKLLILDEPTVGLDPVLRADLWERFAAMAAAGTTLLISSHVMEEASHSSSLLLLREGLLLAQLTPAELGERGHSSDLERAFLNIIRDAEAAAKVAPEEGR
ncbi:ABC transporter ATP-binding protein [Arthrobacter sp. M4]|uniref:ABC transporter ATP-binding protein n=1 Tax=Arthrobacter sp. M4 TaxID=218160 RepID=UPI001CDBA05D|nr:ABC transporter ATP-binding protein [Arthrobacter sp. M4]MCA4133756.1 ABC transporter ATP-binding protein [Arthrobacter sp. M4]